MHLLILFLSHVNVIRKYCHFSVDDLTLVADDKEADAFGPVARDMKIKNLRTYLFIDTFTFFFVSQSDRKNKINFYSLVN